MSATDEEMHNADNLGIDHVSYALFDFSISFLIYLLITFLVNLYSNSGRNASKEEPTNPEAGYTKVNQRADVNADDDGPEAYELTEHASLSGESDAIKIHGEDEVDWLDREPRGGVRL